MTIKTQHCDKCGNPEVMPARYNYRYEVDSKGRSSMIFDKVDLCEGCMALYAQQAEGVLFSEFAESCNWRPK